MFSLGTLAASHIPNQSVCLVNGVLMVVCLSACDLPSPYPASSPMAAPLLDLDKQKKLDSTSNNPLRSHPSHNDTSACDLAADFVGV